MTYRITTLEGEIITQRDAKKRTGTGFPRDMDETFDLSPWGLTWARELPQPVGADLGSLTMNKKAELVNDEWVIGWTAKALDPVSVSRKIVAERRIRLSAGFDYDFGDARGVHSIGTTDADMAGWDEVTKGANALINIGAGSTEINIATNTGACAVTAIEWQAILIAATQFRQPIYAASFALQAMDPIPSDYATNETYWA